MGTFDEILENYKNMVWLVTNRFFPSFPKSLYDLEDVHQIALLALFRASEKYDKSLSAFSTYAYTCINNALSAELEKARAKKRMCSQPLLQLTTPDGNDYITDDSITPVDEYLIDKWTVDEILKRLTELPAQEQLIMYQTCVCGRSIRSVAMEINRPYASVFEQVKKFKLKIREELCDE